MILPVDNRVGVDNFATNPGEEHQHAYRTAFQG